MFVPMPIPPPPVIPLHFYNKYEKLDPETESLQFVASEGTYRPLEEILVAYPAPHPSEPLPNPNPLTPYASPLHTGAHLSIITLAADKQGLRPIETPLTPDRPDEEKEVSVGGGGGGEDASGESESGDHVVSSLPLTPGMTPTEFNRSGSTSTGGGELSSTMTGTSSVFAGPTESSTIMKRKKRTGTSANGTSSTFVSRAIIDPTITTRLAEHRKDEAFVFINISRALAWLDMGSPQLIKHEPLSKLMFSFATVVCHDANLLTSTVRDIDLVIGTNTGDICWYDPATTRYLRYNKQRCINATAVTCIKWLPGSETLFMASHADGALILYDKDREDVEFSSAAAAAAAGGPLEGEYHHHAEQTKPAVAILKSSAQDVRSRQNPVSYLMLSRQQINAFAFSPDHIHLAVVSDDGCLKVMDYKQERVLDVYSSYYGGLTCVAWSQDGHYIVTGGKDDIVTIWSFLESRIIARCHGHSSFINGVYFDPFACDEYTYRIGSISEDGKMCLWDFALSSIHKPASKNRKAFLVPEGTSGRPAIGAADATSINYSKDGVSYHQVESRLCTAILSPITVMQVDDQPPTHLAFLEDRILVATTGKKYARLKSWTRPGR